MTAQAPSIIFGASVSGVWCLKMEVLIKFEVSDEKCQVEGWSGSGEVRKRASWGIGF